jgi:hypothetical protein
MKYPSDIWVCLRTFFFNKCLNIKNNILHSIILNLFENYSMQIKNNTQVEYIKAKSEN